MHDDLANNLLANEVTDLNFQKTGLGVLVDVDVDWEMRVDVAHLVEEALGDAGNHVLDQGADGAQACDALAGAVVHLDKDDALLGLREANGKVTEVLDELACKLEKIAN